MHVEYVRAFSPDCGQLRYRGPLTERTIIAGHLAVRAAGLERQATNTTHVVVIIVVIEPAISVKVELMWLVGRVPLPYCDGPEGVDRELHASRTVEGGCGPVLLCFRRLYPLLRRGLWPLDKNEEVVDTARRADEMIDDPPPLFGSASILRSNHAHGEIFSQPISMLTHAQPEPMPDAKRSRQPRPREDGPPKPNIERLNHPKAAQANRHP